MNRTRRAVVLVLTLVLATGGLSLLGGALSPAQAECNVGEPCSGGGGGGGGGGKGTGTDGTQTESFASSQRVCSVYANGASMGAYCITSGPAAKTLRERFGDQKLQLCRYRDIPDGIPAPFNSSPDKGRYMLMTCLANIDFDTYAGGNDRTFNISIVFVPKGTDIDDRHNGITDFLWRQVDKIAKMPVPFMVTKPNVTPIVGIPTFFTFRWIDPSSKDVVAEGPYKGRTNGGPYTEVDTGGFVMRAQAESVRIDPNQKDIKAVTCAPDTPYREGATAAEQPADACSITFPRSSASARTYATESIPSNVKDAFYASIEVRWRVTYGEPGGQMNELGDGFTMRLRQVLPVQEVQAPNQPPTVIY